MFSRQRTFGNPNLWFLGDKNTGNMIEPEKEDNRGHYPKMAK